MPQKKKPATKPTKADELTLRQQRWIEFYLISGNSTDAARKAGYKGSQNTLCQVGYQNLRKYEIQQRIADRVADSQVEANEVIGTLASQMRADMTEILTPDGHLDIKLIREKRLGHLIKKVKTRRYVEDRGTEDEREVELTEVELHNPQSAAVQLCKVLGIERTPAVPEHAEIAVTTTMVNLGMTRQEAIAWLAIDPRTSEIVRNLRAETKIFPS